jgi:hypothetical protein
LHTVRYAGVLAAAGGYRPWAELLARHWNSRVLRRQTLGDEDDAQGRRVPQTA